MCGQWPRDFHSSGPLCGPAGWPGDPLQASLRAARSYVEGLGNLCEPRGPPGGTGDPLRATMRVPRSGRRTMWVPRSGRRTARGSPWIPRGACKTPGDRRRSTLGQPWILRALLGPRGSTLEAPWDYTGSPGETREPQRTPVGHRWVPVGTPWEHRGTTKLSSPRAAAFFADFGPLLPVRAP